MTQTISLTVTGMKCGGCESNVKSTLQAIAGVVCVRASFKENQVEVEYDADAVDENRIRQAIAGAGFTVA